MRDWAEREAESRSKKVLLSLDPVHGERRLTGESWSRDVVEDVCEVDGRRASSRRGESETKKRGVRSSKREHDQCRLSSCSISGRQQICWAGPYTEEYSLLE